MTYYLKVAKDDMSGLCNQVYNITGCVEHCILNKISRLVCTEFLKEIKTVKFCLLSEVIDMQKLNTFLKQYNLTISDATQEEKANNKFNASPIPYMSYSLNSKDFTHILNHIPFLDKYNEISKNQIQFDRINVIHLRLEDDAVNTFSKEMSIHPCVYKSINEQRYIDCISKYIDKNVMTVVLTADGNNEVIEYLKKNEYKFILTEKVFDKREMNALVDLHIGFMCNTVFIGSYDSSFSYTILNRILKRRNPEFFSCLIDSNKYKDFYKYYTYDTYSIYLSNNNIKSLVFNGSDGLLYA